MSRIGKQPILIPKGVKVEIKGSDIKVSGPKGNLEYNIPRNIDLKQETDSLLLTRKNDEKESRSLHGLARTLINNMVVGVSEGFKKELDIVGVGFRAQMRGKDILNMYLGHSHSIDYFVPQGVTATVEPGKGVTRLRFESCDKQLVGEVAAQIRKLRKPEPYKGKGVRYADEIIKKKVGKAAAGSGK
jgi:large subunit ribosomal protein L6